MSVGAVNKQTGDRIPTAGRLAVDAVLSGTSTNPVQNRVVKEALDGKAGTDMVAADFNAGTSYTAGNYCIHEGKFYKFKVNHSGAWAAADVDEIKIAGELSSLNSKFTDLVKSAEFTVTTDATGNAKLTTEYRKIIGVYCNSNDSPYTLCHARPWWLNNVNSPSYNGTYIEVTTTEDAYNHVKEQDVTGMYYYI